MKKPPPKKSKAYRIEDGITQSMLQTFLACRCRAQFTLDYWEAVRPRDALVFGSLFHSVLDKLYDGYRQGKGPFKFEVFEKEWHKKNAHLQLDSQKVENMMAMAEALYTTYIKHWKVDQQKLFKAVEGVFDIPYGEFRLRGRRDGLFADKKGRLWLLETKTASGIAEDAMGLKLAFDFQNLFYIITFEAETEKKITGVLYNVVVKPGIKMGTKTSPGVKEYYDNLCTAIKAEPDKYFRRFELVYTERAKQKFRDTLEGVLNEYADFVAGKLRVLPSPENCVTRWQCEFLQACSSGSMAGYAQTHQFFRELKD